RCVPARERACSTASRGRWGSGVPAAASGRRHGGLGTLREGPRSALLHEVAVADRAPNAVIFDFDGVLVDSYRAVTGAINAGLGEPGLPAREPAELRHFIGPPTFTAFSELTGEPPASDAVAAIVATYRERYAAVYLTGTAVFDGVVGMLDALARRMPLALATSKSVLFAQPLLEQLGLDRYFAVVAAAADDDTADDKTAIVGRALDALDRAGAVMVGERRAAGADAIVEEPGELVALLDGERPPGR